MKIERIQTFLVAPRWIFVRIDADGLTGWGESIVPKRALAVIGAVQDLARNIVGEDPRRIEDLWQRMYRGSFYRGGPVLATAIAGIEQALWDIKGKMLGVPIYEFLGGLARDRVRAYAWVGGDQPDHVVEQVAERMADGYTAVKMNVSGAMHYLDSFDKVKAAADRVKAVREAYGDAVDIAVDFHGRVHRAMAKMLIQALVPYHLMFIEEPLLEECNELVHGGVFDRSIPIATGERLYTRWDFKTLLGESAVDIIQPDISFTGIHELEKIARMAEAHDVAVAPHCPNGPISLAATLQADACLPNVVIQEHSAGMHYHTGYHGLPSADLWAYLTDPDLLRVNEGFLYPPQGPGLGIGLDEERIGKSAETGWELRDVIWRNADGTVAEW